MLVFPSPLMAPPWCLDDVSTNTRLHNVSTHRLDNVSIKDPASRPCPASLLLAVETKGVFPGPTLPPILPDTCCVVSSIALPLIFSSIVLSCHM